MVERLQAGFWGRGRADAADQGIRLAALRVPLAAKLVGANALVVLVLLAVWGRNGGTVGPRLAIAIGVALVVHLALVLIALRPIRDLEDVAARLWHGDYGARVQRSRVADQQVLRLGTVFNLLLDGLASDQKRMRELATGVIAASDRDRASLARELHDSTAQRVAALLLELASLARDTTDPAVAERLRTARDATEGILDEVSALSHSVHTRVLDDLGLQAALRKLARDASARSDVQIDVDTEMAPARFPPRVEATLHSVAQEAVRNAMRHAAPRHIGIAVHQDGHHATLEIRDDGRGFDVGETERNHPRWGILSMRERVALINGTLEIRSDRTRGTTVSATVPLTAEPDVTLSTEKP